MYTKYSIQFDVVKTLPQISFFFCGHTPCIEVYAKNEVYYPHIITLTPSSDLVSLSKMNLKADFPQKNQHENIYIIY